MAEQTADDLRAALELLDDGRAWTKNVFREERNGVVCRCMFGAVDDATRADDDLPRYKRACNALRDQVPNGRIASFNDAEERTWIEVEAAFQRAIAAEETR